MWEWGGGGGRGGVTGFSCHAATRSLLILRSIKRCGYPGRRESCLSFQAQPVFVFLRLTTLGPSVSSVSSSSPPFCPLSSQEVPAVMMKVLNIRVNPQRVSCPSFFSFIIIIIHPSELGLLLFLEWKGSG